MATIFKYKMCFLAIGGIMLGVLNGSIGALDRIFSFFQREEIQTEITYDVSIPTNVFHRTELICRYIRKEKGYDFHVENLLMLLYLDFIKQSIKSYNPKKVYKLLTTDYYERRSMVLTFGDEVYEIEKYETDYLTLEITIAKEDAEEGQLILDELYDLFKVRVSFNRLLESLWIGFIESYKRGENSRAYSSIVNLLKECID